MKPLSQLAAVLVSLILLGIAFSACGGSPAPSPSPTVNSGVHGVSLIVGGLVGTPRPQPGTRVAVYLGGLDGPLVARTKADAQGKFTLALRPGRYTVVQVSDAAVPATVTVPPGRYVGVKLTIQAR